MNSKIIGAVVVVVVLGGALNFGIGRSGDKSTKTANSSSTTTSSSSQSSAPNTITYTDNGFSPSVLTVKSGTTVTIKNSSSQPLQFDSNPHPQHTDDPELNVGEVAPGASTTFTVTTTGSHEYHNHFSSADGGTIIVQ